MDESQFNRYVIPIIFTLAIGVTVAQFVILTYAITHW